MRKKGPVIFMDGLCRKSRVKRFHSLAVSICHRLSAVLLYQAILFLNPTSLIYSKGSVNQMLCGSQHYKMLGVFCFKFMTHSLTEIFNKILQTWADSGQQFHLHPTPIILYYANHHNTTYLTTFLGGRKFREKHLLTCDKTWQNTVLLGESISFYKTHYEAFNGCFVPSKNEGNTQGQLNCSPFLELHGYMESVTFKGPIRIMSFQR